MQTDDIIFVLVHSLKHEPAPSQAQILTRAEYWRKKAEQRATRYRDYFIERVGPNKFSEEVSAIRREASRKTYDKAIMQKYNVGKNYRENRWFMEQVRPCLN